MAAARGSEAPPPIGGGRLIGNVAAIAAGLVALAAAALALYLLVVGIGWQIAPGQPPGPPRVESRAYPLAVVPLVAAALVVAGVWSQRHALAWVGLVFLGLIGGLTIFGPGLPFLLAAMLLIPLLALVQRFRGRER